MANRIIGGTLFILALTFSAHLAPAVTFKDINNHDGKSPLPGWLASFPEPDDREGLFRDLPGLEPLRPLPHPASLINDRRPFAARPAKRPEAGNLPDQVLKQACGYLYTPYRRGGSSPRGSGTDCSGFVQYVYRNANIDLPRSSSEQAQVGKVAARTMDFSKLLGGDLLFFSRGGRHINHVGIYLGDGKMIHAAGRRYGVIITDLRQSHYPERFVVAKRLF